MKIFVLEQQTVITMNEDKILPGLETNHNELCALIVSNIFFKRGGS